MLAALLAAGAAPGGTVTLEGNLVVEAQRAYLERGGKRITLRSLARDLDATLSDVRLSGRTVKLAGELGEDGSLEVSQLHIVHPDALYRILYYCFT